MKRKNLRGVLAGAAMGMIFVDAASSARALGPTVTAVRTMDENVVQANVIDVSATPLTFGQMKSDVAAAFDAGRGGVIDFDNGSFAGPRTIDALFAGGTKALRLTNGVRDWSIGALGTGNQGAISGANAIFLGAPPSTLNRFVFGDVTDAATGAVLAERVVKFGFTIIDSVFNGIPNNLSITVRYSDGSNEPLVYQIPLAPNTADTFFGFTAPAGTFLTEIEMLDSNNTAGEDFAFITAAVPEPSAELLLVLGMAFVLGGVQRFPRKSTV